MLWRNCFRFSTRLPSDRMQLYEKSPAAVLFADVAAPGSIIVNLLGGSLIGAWYSAGWATRLKSQSLYKIIPCCWW